LPIKVTLLLQSNSEEIKQISFVQHYKRKVVKSKATIQPFATKKIMADDSNEEETGSQQTRQSTRNEGSNGSYKRGAYRGNNNNKNSLQGNIAELGNNVYQYKTQDQGDSFTRTTEAIADYVGREYSKEMRSLVKNQKENEPREPVMPDKEEAKSPFVMKKYRTELKQYYFKKEKYEEHKAKIFVIVKGQCTLNMKNKVEGLQGYDLIEANDDVIKLNGLKELTFKTQEVQYGYWTICQTVRRVHAMRQQDNEPLAEHYKRFTSCVDVAESQWGTLVPTAAATNETNEKRSRDKFITCVFLAGVDTKKYGRLKTELNNAYVGEQNNYPKTVESAVTMLSHYMNGKGVHMTDEDKGQTNQKSFMQKHKNVTCYKCGKKGHYANKCPNGDNDDEASTRSSLSNRRNNSRPNPVGWSG
jgi:hypothetical protein